MLEIALTRIFSVTMWYHFAFVAISVALSAPPPAPCWSTCCPGGSRRTAPPACSAYALLYAVATAVCSAIQLQMPFTPELSARRGAVPGGHRRAGLGAVRVR